jgi:hypothetical protein
MLINIPLFPDDGRPVLAQLGSINLASCAPYELMHLIFENLVPNMVMHWKGAFKWFDHDNEAYRIDGDVHQEIFYEPKRLLESDRAPETHRVLRSPRSVAELRGDSGQTLALN